MVKTMVPAVNALTIRTRYAGCQLTLDGPHTPRQHPHIRPVKRNRADIKIKVQQHLARARDELQHDLHAARGVRAVERDGLRVAHREERRARRQVLPIHLRDVRDFGVRGGDGEAVQIQVDVGRRPFGRLLLQSEVDRD